MLLISLIILFLGAIPKGSAAQHALIFNIEHQDEIHKLVAVLSGLTALFVLFFLSPIIIKCLLGILSLIIFNKVTLVHKN